MKSTRSRSKRILPTGAEPSTAAQPENTSEDQGSQWTQPANEEAHARIAEFVVENLGIFEELERFFKRQGKRKGERNIVRALLFSFPLFNSQ